MSFIILWVVILVTAFIAIGVLIDALMFLLSEEIKIELDGDEDVDSEVREYPDDYDSSKGPFNSGGR